MTTSQDDSLSIATHQREPEHEGHRRETATHWPWLLVVAAWITILLATWTHQSYLISHEYLLEQGGLAWPLAMVVFLGCWQVMTLAMMMPSSLPVLSKAGHSVRTWRQSAEALFLAGYAATWTGFALAAFTGDTMIHWLVDHGTWLSAHTSAIGATTLALAGAYQFCPLKHTALATCQRPLSGVTAGQCPEAGVSWWLGMRHGLACVGNGWALMLVMFGIGMGSLGWMATLAALMVIEKNWQGARRLTPAVGVVLLLLAAVWLAHPAWLPPVQV